MSQFRLRRLGLRREVLILLPLAMLLLVLLSTFTLFSYRSSLQLLTEERQREAAQLARAVATTLEGGPLPAAAELHRRAPTASFVAVIDEQGSPLVTFGGPGAGHLSVPLEATDRQESLGVGPDKSTEGFVLGFARFERTTGSHVVRIDLPSSALARQASTLSRLTWVVLPTNTALLLLVLMFLPNLLRPYEALLEQAHRAGRVPDDEDEVSFLISTVEQALAAVSKPATDSSVDDIEALQRTLGPSLESGLLLLDREGCVLMLNSLGAGMIDVEPPTEPLSLENCLTRQPDLVTILRKAITDGAGLPRQEISIQTDAGARILGLTMHALRRDDGTVRGHLVLFVDLTESQRQAEAEALANSLSQLGELAAGVAHELRNSLATLRGYLTLIERQPDEESITDYVVEIRRESDHLQRVLTDFLTFARPESSRVESVDLLQLVRSAAADPALEGKTVEITTSGAPPGPLHGDAQMLERAIRNLLHNAADADAEVGYQGPVQVHLEERRESIELDIIDHGPGVSPEIRPKLFQPFVTGKSGGVGPGLSLTYRIISLHGGSVRLEDGEQGGTRAVVSFPRDNFE